jgi:hypothetical protein
MSSSVLSAGSFSRHSRTRSRPCNGSVRSISSSSSSSSSESTVPSGRRVKSTSPTSLSVAYRKKSQSLPFHVKDVVCHSLNYPKLAPSKYYKNSRQHCCIKKTMKGCWSGSSSKSACLATMRPWVQTPVPQKNQTKKQKQKQTNPKEIIVIYTITLLYKYIIYIMPKI